MINVSTFQRVTIALVCLLGVLYALPNMLPAKAFDGWPTWMPGKTVNLGLDLQGGIHLLLKVEAEVAVKEMVDNLQEDIRDTLREEKVFPKGMRIAGQGVEFDVSDPAKREAIRERIRERNPNVSIDVLDSGGFRVSFTEKALNDRRRDVVTQALEIIRIRIDELGTREATIQRQGDDRVLVQVPGVDDPEQLKKVLNTTAKLTFHLVHPQISGTGRPPPGYMDLPSTELDSSGKPIHYWVRRKVEVGGDQLVDSQPSFEQNRPVVSFRFDQAGARKFGAVTTQSVGRLLAIVLDNKVISAPRIREPITGGSGIITGQFTVQETQNTALLLRAGALPAPVSFLEERTVGPGLGRDSIEAGKTASIIGLILVLVLMVAVYGLFGLMANVALIFNVAMILALLSILQATLTLPGIAGIVLTIGMAVDANVLIFERIREEMRAGRGPIGSIDAGYRRAMTTIIDSNLTTLIAAVLLFVFGSGAIKGFAVTLSIGLVTSMYTAIMVTRLLVVLWLRRKRPQTLPI